MNPACPTCKRDWGKSLPADAIPDAPVCPTCKCWVNSLCSDGFHTPEPMAAENPCARCGVSRTVAEGGKVFTVCDACWETKSEPMTAERRAELVEAMELAWMAAHGSLHRVMGRVLDALVKAGAVR